MTSPSFQALTAHDLCVEAPDGRRALDGVRLSLAPGELVALVGRSGAGKTLLARALLGLLPPGFRRVRGEIIAPPGALAWLPQEAGASLDPLWTVGGLLRAVPGVEEARVPALLAEVGLDASVAAQLPHMLSGGMAQRVTFALARAAGRTHWIVDETLSGLDLPLQHALLALLRHQCSGPRAIAALLITHDLRLLPGVADRVLVMERGQIVEEAPSVTALRGPGKALWDALQPTRSLARWKVTP